MTLSSLIPLHFVFSFPVIYLTRSIVISEHNHKAVYSLNFGTGWVSQNLYSFLDASSMFLGAECWFVVNCFSCWPTISMVFCTPSSCSFDTLALASCDQWIHNISECIDGRTIHSKFWIMSVANAAGPGGLSESIASCTWRVVVEHLWQYSYRT